MYITPLFMLLFLKQTSKLRTFIRVLLFSLCFSGLVPAESLFQREQEKRLQDQATAQQALLAGDRFYEAQSYGEALKEYEKAISGLGENALSVKALRSAATERYATAAVEHAKKLVRQGKQSKAKAVLETALRKEIAPNHLGAQTYLNQIDDPIRTNPAVTSQHVKEVDQVRRLLYLAQGAHDLGQFDQADAHYEQVLRLDPYNKAARRGLERSNQENANYFKTAYDHSRAKFLEELDASWEDKRKSNIIDDQLLNAVPLGEVGSQSAITARNRINKIVIPEINLEQVSLREAVDFLQQLSVQNDLSPPGTPQSGINFVIDIGDGSGEKTKQIEGIRFDLKLTNVPLRQAVTYMCEVTQTQAKYDEFAVIIQPVGSVTDTLYVRSFRVPPDFLSREAINRQVKERDPFANEVEERALLVEKLSPKDFFERRGVSFPDGSYAFASFDPQGSVLTVKNTRLNLDLVSQIVEAIISEDPVAITVETKFIEVNENIVEELGYDWLISGFSVGGDLTLGGGTVGNQNPDVTSPFSTSGFSPVTNGNRSGDEASGAVTATDAIDLLNVFNRSSNKAPGVLSANALIREGGLQAILRGLSQAKGTDALAGSNVVLRPGQVATVEAVRELIYPEEYEPPTISTGGSGEDEEDRITIGDGITEASAIVGAPATPTSFTMQKVGVLLEVEANVDRQTNIISLRLAPVRRDLEGFLNWGTPFLLADDQGVPRPFGGISNRILQPLFRTVKTNTSVDIYSGTTIALGGILTESVQNVEDKTPILGDLPGVGRFFQRKSQEPNRTAFIVFVTARVTDAGGNPL